MSRKTAFTLTLLLPFVVFQQQAVKQAPAAPNDYEIYAAAVDLFHADKKASHPVVADRTSTFSCSGGCNGLQIGGCDGLRGSDETPKERLAIVRRDLPRVTAAMADDFERRNQKCSEIEAKVPAKAKYILVSQDHAPDLPEGWEDMDYFFFSRPAFDAEGTQALLYIGFMSGANAKYSEGKYFLFVKKSGAWVAQGTSSVWKLQRR